jgi:hypothetical protein
MGWDLGSEIRDPEKTYSGSRIQKGTGSRIRIRSTDHIYIISIFELEKPTEDEIELCDLSVPHFLVHGVAVISVRLTAESLLPSQNLIRLDLDLL